MSGINDKIEDELAKILQEDIDWEIMVSLMVEVGWRKVTLTKPSTCHTSFFDDLQEIQDWCDLNVLGKYMSRHKTWIFAEEKDAMLFSLRWL